MAIVQKWMKWTLFESLTRITLRVLQKIVGFISTSFSHSALAAGIIGTVQVVVSAFFLLIGKKKFTAPKDQIIGSVSFGFFATYSTIVPMTVYWLGGDLGVNAFIISLSIVPGALIDWIFFKHPLNARQWLGVGISLLGAYAILGSPSTLGAFLEMPLWVWLAATGMIAIAINQGITQKVKNVDALVQNFWGGLTTAILSVIVLAVVGSLTLVFDFSRATPKFLAFAAVSGLVTLFLWCFNLLSYKDGASIAIKKLVMQGILLIGSMTAGIAFFGEPFTVGKVLGALFFLVAFCLVDKGTWNAISSKLKSAT